MADFQVKAVSKYIIGAPIKMRRVVNSVRGMPAQQALEVLKLLPQAAADPVYKTVKSALANAEEARVEDSDERGSTDLALQRMEAKLDLLTGLIGALLRRDSPAMPARAICWSRLGIRLASDIASATGERGLLRLQPADWLPEFLEIPVTVIASETSDTGSRLWLRFDPLPAALESALDRHLFRAHRRQIADARRQRIVPAN